MNWRKVRLLDVINPKKWFIVFDAYRNKARGVTLERCYQAVEMSVEHGEFTADFWCRMTMGQPLKYAEIVVDRANACYKCVETGSCIHCGCTSPDNMFSLHNKCSAGNWGAQII